MDLVIFEENKPFVLKCLGNGDFDYIESASEVYETDFFRFIKARTILDKLTDTYPTPRKKEDVPLWFIYIKQPFHAASWCTLLQCLSNGGSFRGDAQCFWT